jgi:hypothetical protein
METLTINTNKPLELIEPQFIILGAQKAGTSSLFIDMICHSQILPASSKELHYFDYRYHEPISWYLNCFPAIEETGKKKRGTARKDFKMTGEATPYYFFHPHVPQRVFQHFPKIKLILLFRNPVHRAISQYRHNKKMWPDMTPDTFEEALRPDDQFFKQAHQNLIENPYLDVLDHNLFSYRQRGLYLEQLLNWEKYFPKEQFYNS